jgi:DNA helicase-2/ATP-dependent DNA helicase PcrA
VSEFLQKHFVEYNQEEAQKGSRKHRTAAILLRARRDFDRYFEALKNRGIPCQVVGLGGLLSLPEIQDIIAFLQISSNSERSDSLLRILNSARIGVEPETLEQLSAQTKREKTLIEVIENLADFKDFSNSSGLKRLQSDLKTIKRFLDLPVDLFVAKVVAIIGFEQELKLMGHSTESIELFLEQARKYAKHGINSSIAGFLDYLEVVLETEQGFDTPISKPDPNAVQIITIHGAKGLEWDVVCCPANSYRQFQKNPSSPYRKSQKIGVPEGILVLYPDFRPNAQEAWLKTKKKLPDNLRLDKNALTPLADLTKIESVIDYDLEVWKFESGSVDRTTAEERRLAYVAFTRARSHLLITASLFVREKGNATVPTAFFYEAYGHSDSENSSADDVKTKQNELLSTLKSIFTPYESAETDTNPVAIIEAKVGFWPKYLEEFEKDVYWQKTAEIYQKLRSTHIPNQEDVSPELQLLITDLEFRKKYLNNLLMRPLDQLLPQNISASSLVKLAQNSEQALYDILRPMPQRPLQSNLAGTLFHKWVEQYYLTNCVGEYDESISSFVENFLQSDWAKRTPIEVEKEIYSLANKHSVVTRIDAVFEDPNDLNHLIIVDWKTGRPPKNDFDRREKAVQLAVYRQSYINHLTFENSLSKKSSNFLPVVSANFVYVSQKHPQNIWSFSAEELSEIYEDTISNFG